MADDKTKLTVNPTTGELDVVQDVTDLVEGSPSSTDNAVARHDGTTGRIIQNSAVIIDDSGKMTLGADGTANLDAVTKQQLDAVTDQIQNLEWQDSVINATTTAPPGSPAVGARYLLGLNTTVALVTGAWAGQDGSIAEWNGSNWVFTQPTNGMFVAADNEPTFVYRFGGTAWFEQTFESTTASGFLSKDVFDIQLTNLVSQNVIVGNGSNEATSVDTNANGDVSADTTNGLLIKSGAVDNANISPTAAIDATKIADGSVSNAEFEQLDGVGSPVVGESDTNTLQNKTIDATAATGNNTLSADAVDISYNNASSGLTANEAQGAIDELKTSVDAAQKITITQASHGFAVGDGIYHNGTSWAKAQANDSATLATFCVVETPDANTFSATQFSRVEATAHGFTVGEYYFLSDSVAGAPALTEPVTGFSNPLFFVEDANTLQILVYRPSTVGTNIDLDDLADVSVPSPNNNDVLSYNGVSWIAAAPISAASDVTYDNSSSALVATDAQAAIDEVEARVDTAETSITTNAADIATNSTDIELNAPVLFINENFESATTSLVPYKDAADQVPEDGTGGSPTITVTADTVTPLVGTQSAVINKPASNTQGEGVAILSQTIDEAYLGQQQNVDFFWRPAAGYVADTFRLYVYYPDTDVVEPIFFQDKLGNFTNNLPADVESFSVSGLITPQGSSYRIIVHCATIDATAMTATIDEIKCGPALGPVQSSIITEWVDYTPTGSWANTTYTGKWRRVGDSLEAVVTAALTGTPTPTNFLVNPLPDGLSLDFDKINSLDVRSNFGSATIIDRGTRLYVGTVGYNSGSDFLIYHSEAGNTGVVNQASPFTFVNTDGIEARITVPIQGWSSGTLVGTNELRQQAVKAKVGLSANQTVSSSGTVQIQLDQVLYDPQNMFDPANNYLVIPFTGTYRITVNVQYDNHGTESQILRVNRNSNAASATDTLFQRVGVFNGSTESLGGSVEVDLIAGDTIRATVDSAVDSSYTINSFIGSTFLSVQRIPDLSVFTQFQKENAPTVSRLTSGSGTYITPAGAKYLRVRMVGGGGGGAGSGNVAVLGGASGAAGGTTTFGTATAIGGGGASSGGGVGGSTTNPDYTAVQFTNGGIGNAGIIQNGDTNSSVVGGMGGSTVFGGAGGGGYVGGGGAGGGNTGAGGGGAGASTNAGGNFVSGGGAGAGGYIEFLIEDPEESYSYSVGSGGAGGTAGSGGNAGGAGGSGVILVEAYVPELVSPSGGDVKNVVQTKILTADVTADGTMSDLTFNNLTVGKTYEINLQVFYRIGSGLPDNIGVTVLNGSDVIANTGTAVQYDAGDAFPFSSAFGKFTATSTTVTFIAGSISLAGNAILADGTKGRTFAQLEERNDLQETDKF